MSFYRQTDRQTERKLLGEQKSVWIEIQQLWTRWIGARINTFVLDGDNDVCFAAAREFFYDQPTPNSVGDARSTDALNVLLHDYYCQVPSGITPRFGDVLYIPPADHAGRFVLKDPHSGRSVVASVQSGGNVPYRLYWFDEDFSGDPFAHKAVSEAVLFQNQVDVWRRCK